MDPAYDKIRPDPFPDLNEEKPNLQPVDRGGADLSRAISVYCQGFDAGFEDAYRQFVKGALIGMFLFGLARLLAWKME